MGRVKDSILPYNTEGLITESSLYAQFAAWDTEENRPGTKQRTDIMALWLGCGELSALFVYFYISRNNKHLLFFVLKILFD